MEDCLTQSLLNPRTTLLTPAALEGIPALVRAALGRLGRRLGAGLQRPVPAPGFLPPAALQQRTLFDEVVRPLTQEAGWAMAYFLVDALRYEMGEELHRMMQGTPATTLQLKARLAELPTVTEVGMNALAPVEQGGRLRPMMTSGGVQGFSTGEFRVADSGPLKPAGGSRHAPILFAWARLSATNLPANSIAAVNACAPPPRARVARSPTPSNPSRAPAATELINVVGTASPPAANRSSSCASDHGPDHAG